MAIVLLQFAYPIFSCLNAVAWQRQQMGTGLILASAGAVASALLAALAAAAGI